MKLILLFVVTSVAGGLGKLAGLFAGAAVAPGVGILLQVVVGSVLFVASAFLAVRMHLIRRFQLGWTVAAGILGVGMGTLVTLSTLSSPIAPWLVPGMIGMGAALGSLIGKSAHERTDLT